MMKAIKVSILASSVLVHAAPAHHGKHLPANAQNLLDESMRWMDTFYDSSESYLYDTSAITALRHETRSSVWYALGLLARNKKDDVHQAESIISNTVKAQFKEPSEQWYGDYQKYPEEPYVGSPVYEPDIYNSWDPNWRGFIGTTLIIAMEEYEHLLANETKELVLESLYNATKGDEYRVGGVDDDNLYPAYSNPSIMRAFMSGWTGRRLNEANMTLSGDKYAQDIIDLFDRNNTLSEFNSGTYTGVSLYGLTLWCKYLPQDSVMAQHGPFMVRHTWEAVSELWHPGMKNMAGPWDRAYGYDMNRYLSLMALWFWVLVGKDHSSLISQPQVMSHSADYTYAPCFAVLAAFHRNLVPDNIIDGLTKFSGEHIFTASTYYPPIDKVPRNITTWLSDNLTIGAESFDENGLGGPAQSQEAFNPAVIQWWTGDEISFISLYPTETALQVSVSPNKLNLSYPSGNSSSIFTLIVGTFKQNRTIADWSGVVGLDVDVSTNANASYILSFGGAMGGEAETIRDFEVWNFTYVMPEDFEGVPSLQLDVKVQ
ncbi:hypothetical protein Q7P37_004873 [Cladosporium fusiforme]